MVSSCAVKHQNLARGTLGWTCCTRWLACYLCFLSGELPTKYLSRGEGVHLNFGCTVRVADSRLPSVAILLFSLGCREPLIAAPGNQRQHRYVARNEVSNLLQLPELCPVLDRHFLLIPRVPDDCIASAREWRLVSSGFGGDNTGSVGDVQQLGHVLLEIMSAKHLVFSGGVSRAPGLAIAGSSLCCYRMVSG